MEIITGRMATNTSAQSKDRPVVVDIQTSQGIKYVSIDHPLWDAFVANHPNINDPEFRVEVWGEIFDREIRCLAGCEFCPDRPTDD